jgi:hypothetical protein
VTFPSNPFRAPHPPVKIETVKRDKKLPAWLTIPVGESWIADRREYNAALTHGKRHGKKFSCRTVPAGLRITRIA